MTFALKFLQTPIKIIHPSNSYPKTKNSKSVGIILYLRNDNFDGLHYKNVSVGKSIETCSAKKWGNRPTFPVEEGKTGPNGRPLPVVAMTTAKRKH